MVDRRSQSLGGPWRRDEESMALKGNPNFRFSRLATVSPSPTDPDRLTGSTREAIRIVIPTYKENSTTFIVVLRGKGNIVRGFFG